MRAPLHRSSSGFVLLHTLWLLLTASALVSALLVFASRASSDFALLERETRQELAQESAVELVIHDIVLRGAKSLWLQLPYVSDEIEVEDQNISVTVQNVAGLLDIGSVDSAVLTTLLDRTLHKDKSVVRARIESARSQRESIVRPFSTYVELRATMHVSDHYFSCLYQYVTLFSGRTKPDPLLVTPALGGLLGMDSRELERSSAMEIGESAAGSTYRIEAITRPINGIGSQVLSVEVTITGRRRPSHLVRSWQYLPRFIHSPSCR